MSLTSSDEGPRGHTDHLLDHLLDHLPTTTPAPGRRGGPGHRLEVLRTERLTPHLVRVVLGGPGLAGVADTAFTDRYVELAFPRPGLEYPEPFDLGAIRETMPRADG